MTTLKAAGWLLLIGGACAVAGAFTPPYRQWSAPLEEGLRVIAGHPWGWRLIHAGFLLGTVLSAVGLALFASALRDRPGGAVALASAVVFCLASALWIANIATRLTVTPWAAAELVATGAVPASFTPWRGFAGALFGGFSALGYASVAGLGWSCLSADLGPRWLGWLLLAWGLSGGFVVGAMVPVIMYVALIVLGVFAVR